MKRFADLYRDLESTTSNLGKQRALQNYLREAPKEDAAWAVYLLSGGTPRRPVPSKIVREVTQEMSQLPTWMVDECYEAVGDLAEALSLLLPAPARPEERPLAEWMGDLLNLKGTDTAELPARLREQIERVPFEQRLVYFKLMMGAFRVGVSRLHMTKALSEVSGVDAKTIAQRLMGMTNIDTRPTSADMEALLQSGIADGQGEIAAGGDTRPYPFFLAHPVPRDTELEPILGDASDWLAEWKWDGIRAQCIHREGGVAIWSRGEELITDRFPEIAALMQHLPAGTVVDGELVLVERTNGAWAVRPFADLQKRIGRKNLSPKMLKELPAFLIAFDVLEYNGQDLRETQQAERRSILERLCREHPSPTWDVSPLIVHTDWGSLAKTREQARLNRSEGLMLKHREARYGVGRTKSDGVWWKWKLDPLSVDAVLVYAQKGHGRRSNIYSDYTFAVWDKSDVHAPKLVPFAKAYSGLTDEEMQQVDSIVRKTTRETFGPVRSVEPTLVFEIGFEGIARSTRHKSGIATRFPRMLKWRHDKRVEDADTLDTLHQLVNRA